MDIDNEKPRPPQGGSSEPSMDTDKMYADDNESPSEDEDGEPSMSPSGDGDPSIGTGNWRSQLQPDSRQRIINKMHVQRKKEKLVIIGVINDGADYLWKISLKMLTMETKSQNTMANSLQSNSDELMDTDNEMPRPPQGGSREPSVDTDEMYTDDDDESPSEDGEPSIDADEIFTDDDDESPQ